MKNTKLRNLILTALFTALTAAGAFIRIPAPLAPITLQCLFTFMAGILLGAKWGAVSQLVYLLLGLFGLPVFATGGGFGYVMQPSFGFLLGLVSAAYLAGKISGRGGRAAVALGCIAGWAALYVVGLPYMHLMLTLHLKKAWTVWQTVKGGMLLFLPGDALKIALCVWLCPIVKRRLKSQ